MARRKNDIPFSLFSFQDIITATTGILILLSLVLALSVITQGAESVIDDNIADESLVVERERLQNRVRLQKSLLDQLTQQNSQIASATPVSLSREIEELEELLEDLTEETNELAALLARQKKTLKDLTTDKSAEEKQIQLAKRQKEIKDLNKQLEDLKKNDRLKFNFRDSTRSAWLVEISDKKILAARVNSNAKPKSFNSAFAFNDFADDVSDAEKYFVLVVKPSGVSNYDAIKVHLSDEGADIGVDVIGETQTAIDPIKGVGF